MSGCVGGVGVRRGGCGINPVEERIIELFSQNVRWNQRI